jgi:hypothetical protein
MKRGLRNAGRNISICLALLAMLFGMIAAFNPGPALAEGSVWDGSVDVSWYNATDTVFYISTTAQLAGLAALVNGHVDAGVTPEMITGSFTPSADYWTEIDDFDGKTIYLTADLDMGGVYESSAGAWSGPNYTPVGGQWCTDVNDISTCLSTSFNGTLDGQGHTVKNIYCDRYTAAGYSYSQAVGLVGRLGCHDSDDISLRADNPTVRNVVVTGYIYGRRSVGGVVGKIGKTNYGGIIENCANFASVNNTDSKGCGGIVGAGWNGGYIKSCYNAGSVRSAYTCPTGGISGSNEINIFNCYNVGSIAAASGSYAMAIGTNNGGSPTVSNCYWLNGSAPGGGYYGGNGTEQVTEVTSEYLKSAEFLAAINSTGRAFVADTNNINNGYPILRVQTGDTSTLTDITKVSDPARLSYVAGQTFDDTGLEIRANYSDGTTEKITDYTISKTTALETTDTVITVSGTYDGMSYSYDFPITVDASAVLTTVSLSGSPNLNYSGTPFTYDLNGLTLTGQDQNGGAFDIIGQAVTWAVISGPAAVSGSTLTITGSGTVNVAATVSGVTSNTLGLIVNASAVLPDEIILSWTGDTETTQTVSWRTADAAFHVVQYLPAGSFDGSFDGAQVANASASFLYTGDVNDWYHEEATISGLSPATSYVYSVGREGAWSEPASFTTAGSGDQFSFLYMGDVQTGFSAWGNLLNTASAESADPKFALLGGDLVDLGTSGSEWEQFFDAATPVFKQIPLMPAAGNHDDMAGTLFWNSFALPENGPEGYAEKVYSFDYNNCHIVVLDSELLTEPGTDSYTSISAWLTNDLNSSDKTWKFVCFHYPPYPVVDDRHTANLQANWVPVLEQCNVDAAFVGHQHVYMRTKPMEAGQVTTEGSGIVYFMGVAGGQLFAPGDARDYIATEIPYVSNYELINIDDDTLTLTAKGTNGQVIDSYVMTKQVTVPVTGVSLDKTSATITAGGTDQLTATVTPAEATNKSVTWASDNTAAATVSDSGLVTAVAAGTATITVTTVDGGYTATCAVTVTAAGSDTSAPTWPGGSLTAGSVTSSSLKLTWSAAADNVGVTGYKVYQGNTLLGTVKSRVRTYNVSRLSANTTYTFSVQAGDAAGNWSSDGPSTTVTTIQEAAPAAPKGLKASVKGTAEIDLTWRAVKGCTYNVYRSDDNGAAFSQVATGLTSTSFKNTGLASKTTYLYYVTAVNSAGESSASIVVTATTKTSA